MNRCFASLFVAPLRATFGVASLGLLLGGCASLAPQNQALLARDMLEVKNKLDKQIEEQSSYQRRTEYTLGKLSEDAQSNSEIQKNAVDDLERRMREMIDEMQKLRAQVEELEFSVTSGKSTTGAGSTFTSPADPNAAAGPLPGAPAPAPGTPADSAAAGGGSALDQALMSAQNQFNLGRFAEAREGFRRALELNPQGDKRLDVLFGLAETSNKLKDFPTAIESYKQLIRANPQSPRAWTGLHRMAEIKIEQGEKDEALRLLKQFDANQNYPEIARIKELRQQVEGASAGQ